ncbi:MAG: hypothetical protein EPN47_14080 [Acidobacteria bacterium]|nr:MAG: hypothetical protein EPN47_14080 [Acidobacteriota bacterium]
MRLDQVDSLQVLSSKTGIPSEKLAGRWLSSSQGDAHRASGKKLKPFTPPKGTVPHSTSS